MRYVVCQVVQAMQDCGTDPLQDEDGEGCEHGHPFAEVWVPRLLGPVCPGPEHHH